MLVEVEILRTRTVTIDESAVAEIDVPDNVPEEGQEDWILEQISEGHLTVADSEFEISDETEDSEYQEINKV